MKTNLKSARRLIALSLILTLANAASVLVPHTLPTDYLKFLSAINLLGCIALALEAFYLERLPASAEPGAPAAARPLGSREARTRHELAAFLGLLQEKGRLVDFLMEDITTHSDARVGQVARVVHQGCREVLRKHFDLVPVTDAAEGSTVEFASIAVGELRRIGSVGADAPSRGILRHAGWVSRSVTLPELTRELPEDCDRYLVAPAEVESTSRPA